MSTRQRLTLNPFQLAVLLLALLSTTSAGLATKTRRAFIIFGDSLSDNGNFFRSKIMGNSTKPAPYAVVNGTRRAAYWNGRFTNAPGVWNDRLVTQLRRSTVANFAHGGAALCSDYDGLLAPIPAVTKQVSMYLARKQRDVKFKQSIANMTTIPVIWAGTNDLQIGIVYRPAQLFNITTQLPFCLTRAARTLLNGGEQTVIVAALVPLDKAPVVAALGVGGLAAPIVNQINAVIKQEVSKLQSQYPKKTVLYWDVHTDVSADVVRYQALGFKYNSSVDCLQSVGKYKPLTVVQPTYVCPSPDEYLFFDLVHPSSRGHQIVANSFLKLLLNSSIISQSDIIPNPWFPKCTECLKHAK